MGTKHAGLFLFLLIAAGARAYLTKPIGVLRLLEVVDEFLGDTALTASYAEPSRHAAQT